MSEINDGGPASAARHQRTGLPLKGCPASNAIKGNHERDAYGRCALCGDGPQPTKRGDSEYTMGDWWRDLENPHGNR